MDSMQILNQLQQTRRQKGGLLQDKSLKEQELEKLKLALSNLTSLMTSIDTITSSLNYAQELLPYAYKNDGKSLDNGEINDINQGIKINQMDFSTLSDKVSLEISKLESEIIEINNKIKEFDLKINSLNSQYNKAITNEKNEKGKGSR